MSAPNINPSRSSFAEYYHAQEQNKELVKSEFKSFLILWNNGQLNSGNKKTQAIKELAKKFDTNDASKNQEIEAYLLYKIKRDSAKFRLTGGRKSIEKRRLFFEKVINGNFKTDSEKVEKLTKEQSQIKSCKENPPNQPTPVILKQTENPSSPFLVANSAVPPSKPASQQTPASSPASQQAPRPANPPAPTPPPAPQQPAKSANPPAPPSTPAPQQVSPNTANPPQVDPQQRPNPATAQPEPAPQMPPESALIRKKVEDVPIKDQTAYDKMKKEIKANIDQLLNVIAAEDVRPELKKLAEDDLRECLTLLDKDNQALAKKINESKSHDYCALLNHLPNLSVLHADVVTQIKLCKDFEDRKKTVKPAQPVQPQLEKSPEQEVYEQSMLDLSNEIKEFIKLLETRNEEKAKNYLYVSRYALFNVNNNWLDDAAKQLKFEEGFDFIIDKDQKLTIKKSYTTVMDSIFACQQMVKENTDFAKLKLPLLQPKELPVPTKPVDSKPAQTPPPTGTPLPADAVVTEDANTKVNVDKKDTKNEEGPPKPPKKKGWFERQWEIVKNGWKRFWACLKSIFKRKPVTPKNTIN